MIDSHADCSGGRYFDGYDDLGNIKTICRSLVCSRCGLCTGNNNQGHWWTLCNVTKTIREFHFCCPGDCELQNE